MNVERDEEGERFNPFLAAPNCCCDLTPTPGQGGKPGLLQGLGVEQLGLFLPQVSLAETVCRRQLCTALPVACVPPQVC